MILRPNRLNKLRPRGKEVYRKARQDQCSYSGYAGRTWSSCGWRYESSCQGLPMTLLGSPCASYTQPGKRLYPNRPGRLHPPTRLGVCMRDMRGTLDEFMELL